MARPIVGIMGRLLAAAAASALFSLLHALPALISQCQPDYSGTAINMIAGALTIFLARNTRQRQDQHYEWFCTV